MLKFFMGPNTRTYVIMKYIYLFTCCTHMLNTVENTHKLLTLMMIVAACSQTEKLCGTENVIKREIAHFNFTGSFIYTSTARQTLV